ncbi:PREDICTED: uncharacterized protein LOC104719233 [Camelina sativa]|uniref:Uncharacterized protein LOC104719233 n=1 Tax=Camelina sativa TaxID=90675 RepID=A0ABM0U3V1_CAMSA|nr:PREDICTED: uncharacterized protein LOC104719233 [Camelina sativa]
MVDGLGKDDPYLFIPHTAYVEAIAKNRLSLIALPLNPTLQSLHVVVDSLPRTWGLASRVHGRVLNDRLRFFPQSALGMQQSSTDSNITPSFEEEINPKIPRCFEVSESSKRKILRLDLKVTYGNQKQKFVGVD